MAAALAELQVDGPGGPVEAFAAGARDISIRDNVITITAGQAAPSERQIKTVVKLTYNEILDLFIHADDQHQKVIAAFDGGPSP